MDAIALLKKDHQKVESLFTRFEALEGQKPGGEKQAIVEELVRELSMHAVIEEQFLYPLIRERDEALNKLALEALEEHHVAKWLLLEIDRRALDDERFDAKMKVMIENVRHHVREEEEELFPLMEKLMAREELEALGRVLDDAKLVAPSRPHPRAPDHPPGNIVVGMMSKVIDTGRDTVRTLRRKGIRAAAKTVRRRA